MTDTHFGGGPDGYTQQPRHLERLDELFAVLADWLKEVGADALVHGGDLTEAGTPAERRAAGSMLAALPVPAWLCLGNHDLLTPGAFAGWCEEWPTLVGEDGTFAHQLPGLRVVVGAVHWHADDRRQWCPQEPQMPRLDAQQCRRIAALADCADPVLLCLHAPLNAVPPEQTGLEAPYHPPADDYFDTVVALAERCPRIRLVFAGHNHINSLATHPRFVSTTTAAFTEGPCDVRLISVDADQITLTTHALRDRLAPPLPPLDPDRHWVAGAAAQRDAVVPVTGEQSAG
jgi:hypothetical protein